MNTFGRFWKNFSKQTQRTARRRVLLKRERKSLLESLEDRRMMVVSTPVKYDFGTMMSPAASGYWGINETTTYGGMMSMNFGWNTAPSSADLGSSYSDLLRDYHYNSSAKTWKVDL